MRLRSLVIALDLPLPVTGGGDLRTLAIVHALTRLGPVSVFGVHPRAPRPSPIEGVARWRSSTDASLADPGLQARAALAWLHEEDGHPCDRWWSERAAADLARLADEFEPHLVVAEQLWVHRYGEAIRSPGRSLVLDAHNAEAALHAQLATAGAGARGGSALARRLAERVARREHAAVARADRTWAPTASDAAAIAAVHPPGAARFDVVPSGIAVDAYAGPAGERGHAMIYPASFGYPPNAVAARRLVTGVLPVARSAVPGAELLLPGSDLPRELAEAAGVHAPGRVADMLPWLHRASVMPIALSDGGGTRLKVLEAFAAGVAVVSTRKGVEGLDVRDGEHVLLGESDAQLAAAVLRVWKDDGLRRRLTVAGAALARERYGPDAVAAAVARAAGFIAVPAAAGSAGDGPREPAPE